jgi:hypothetical protein
MRRLIIVFFVIAVVGLSVYFMALKRSPASVSPSIPSATSAPKPSFTGTWSWQDASRATLTLHLTETDDVISGGYCMTGADGKKDCGAGEKNAVTGRADGMKAQILFSSQYNGTSGIATIELIGKQVQWTLLVAPQGSEVPATATLLPGDPPLPPAEPAAVNAPDGIAPAPAPAPAPVNAPAP